MSKLVGHEVLAGSCVVRLPESSPPVLVVAVDTEEEFDWSESFDRNATSVTAMGELHRACALFEERDVRPVYLVDYPVVAQAAGIEALARALERNRAEVGVQLHTWVTPPFEEDVNPRNSYQGNLDPELEARKLAALVGKVEESLGVRPRVHKAGRYGFGFHTAETLRALGLNVDLSVAPAFDFSADGGPDYRQVASDAYWLGPGRDVLGVPTTGGFVGRLKALGPRVYGAQCLARPGGALSARVLSKSRLLERILLSPEGHSFSKIRRLTLNLMDEGLRVFTLSFHSPTLKPGCTGYTTTARDVEVFLDRCRRYLDFFLGELDGRSMTPSELRDRLLDEA